MASKKKSPKQQLMEDILEAGKITVVRNTKASGKVLLAGTDYNVPEEVSIEDALELVAVVRKAVFGKSEEAKAIAKAAKAQAEKTKDGQTKDGKGQAQGQGNNDPGKK